MSKPILWIVIPCYNEEQVLPITAPMFLQKITSLTEKGMISDKSRVLFVNDGSRDKTWELMEDLRGFFRAADGSEAAELLGDWMHRAAYCKIAKVVAVEKKVRRRRDDIIAAVELGISNGRVEAINNKINEIEKEGE